MSEKVLGVRLSQWRKLNGAEFDCSCEYCKKIRSKLVSVVSLQALKEKVKRLQGKERWCLCWDNAGAEEYVEHDTEYFDTREDALERLEDLKRNFGEFLEWDEIKKIRKPEIDADYLLSWAEKEAKK